MFKRILSLTLAAVLCFTMSYGLFAQAVKFGDVTNVPKDYWALVAPYDAALESGNLRAIASNGEKILEFWFKGGTAEKRAAEWKADAISHGYEINNCWVVSREVALTYEKLGDYKNAVRMFKVAIAFIDPYKELMVQGVIKGNAQDMEFSRTGMLAKIAAYEVDIELYAEIDQSSGVGDKSYKGAKHEPETGIYFGVTASGSAVKEFDKQHSSMVIYVEFEDENMQERINYDLRQNELLHNYDRNDYSILQIAWNFKYEGSTLKNVPNYRQMITEAAQYLNSLGTPILLRIGAEMNIWEDKANPADYIAAFRYIANIMRQNAPNVALQWCVNYVSHAEVTYDMFYPGAEYVDWVGISLYTRRYNSGDPNTTEAQAAIWSTGKFANPIKFIENIVSQYGAKHPIVISECGVTLWNNSNNEDLTNWALPRIRQTYAYIPMLFPQVKAIYWFNAVMPKEAVRFDFNVSPRAQALYEQLTASGYFLGKGQVKPTITYKKLGTAILPASKVALLTYAPYFAFDDITIQYMLNGEKLAQSSDIPYRQSLDLSGRADGQYKLQVVVLQGGNTLNTKEYSLVKKGTSVTVSSGSASSTPTPSPTPSPKPIPTPETTKMPSNAAGNYYYTDIVVYLWNTPVNAINVGGAALIDAESLAHYGFEVKWYAAERKLTIDDLHTSAISAKAADGSLLDMKGGRTGTVAGQYFNTDIVTYLNGAEIKCYNTGGRAFIDVDAMSHYGYNVEWNNAQRTLTISRL